MCCSPYELQNSSYSSHTQAGEESGPLTQWERELVWLMTSEPQDICNRFIKHQWEGRWCSHSIDLLLSLWPLTPQVVDCLWVCVCVMGFHMCVCVSDNALRSCNFDSDQIVWFWMLIDFDLKACVCVCGAELGWLFGVSCVFSFPLNGHNLCFNYWDPPSRSSHAHTTRAGGGVVAVLMNYNVV